MDQLVSSERSRCRYETDHEIHTSLVALLGELAAEEGVLGGMPIRAPHCPRFEVTPREKTDKKKKEWKDILRLMRRAG